MTKESPRLATRCASPAHRILAAGRDDKWGSFPGDEDHVGRTLARAARGARGRRKAEDQRRSHTGETDGDRPTPRRGHS